MAITITTANDILKATEHYGILPFWSQNEFSAWQLCNVDFNSFWDMRMDLINEKKLVYGKFWNKKSAFCSLDLFPYLASLRRDGYDFDTLTDEGRNPRNEILVMNAVKENVIPSYATIKSINLKNGDAVVASLQNKTFLCTLFAPSRMGTALLVKPEVAFGYDYTRSKYSLSHHQLLAQLNTAPVFKEYDGKTTEKVLKIMV